MARNTTLGRNLTVQRVGTPAARRGALDVLARVFEGEKGWIEDSEAFLPEDDLDSQRASWFLASIDGRPIGVMRVLYELPVDLYEAYAFELVDRDLDVAAFLAEHRIAEIGRFAVVPEYRKRIHVAAILMRAAVTETLERDFTHFITDVFETDPNSPYKFHQKILGFRTVATHSIGELGHVGRRITMLLDIRQAFRRLRRGNSWLYRYLTQGWGERFVAQIGN